MGPAAAHPLGNFTINHLAKVMPNAGGIRVVYVLDIAEIPTFQIMHAGAAWTGAQMQAWIDEEATRVAGDLSIEASGSTVSLKLRRATGTTRPGAGGLPTLYWTGEYTATIPPRAAIVIEDRVYADRRIGWRDIIVPGLFDPTNALRSYPNAMIGSPRHNDRATFDFERGRITHVAVSGTSEGAWSAGSIVRTSALSDLFSRNDQSPLLIVLTVLAAFGLGALHGLEPGHGKALLAFTLVGARATFKQAILLAASLTFVHTIAVLLLGVALFFVAGFATESIFTWITLLSGIVVVAIGARSLSRAVSKRAHPHDHGRHHAIAGSQPLQFPSAVAAAMSGGVAPCPAAIVVLLAALHAHRLGYGLFVIVVFSLGLATILTGLGIAVVHGSAWLQRRSSFTALSRTAPILTGAVISAIGATMVAQGFAAQGFPLPEFAIAAITLAGIVLFALVPRRSTEKLQAA
jgi:nickel/cobalt exporter